MPKLTTDIIIDLVILAMVFFGGYYLKGLVDNKEQAKAYAAQVEANQKAQDELNIKSKQVETELAAERLKSADLNKKWSDERAKKTHTVCALSGNTQQLLRDATSK